MRSGAVSGELGAARSSRPLRPGRCQFRVAFAGRSTTMAGSPTAQALKKNSSNLRSTAFVSAHRADPHPVGEDLGRDSGDPVVDAEFVFAGD